VIRWFDGNEAIANPTTRRGARIVDAIAWNAADAK
jgi:hypothetical protein